MNVAKCCFTSTFKKKKFAIWPAKNLSQAGVVEDSHRAAFQGHFCEMQCKKFASGQGWGSEARERQDRHPWERLPELVPPGLPCNLLCLQLLESAKIS